MKNLILPFLAIAFFAIGSCGEETSVNPLVDKSKDTTKHQDTTKNQDTANNTDTTKSHDTTESLDSIYLISGGRIHINKIPAMIEFAYQIGPNHAWGDETKESEITLKSEFTAAFIRRNLDTIILTKEYSDIYGRIKHDSLSIVLDTSMEKVQYLAYFYKDDLSDYNYTRDRSTMSFDSTVCSFTLHNLSYTKTDSSLIINPLPSVMSDFYYATGKGELESTNNQKSWFGNLFFSRFISLLPFTTQSSFTIELLLRK